MKQHTPGPWRIWQNRIAPNVTETEIYDSENYKLANIARWRGESAEESEANARLIAAAPDLLAVLSAIVSDYHALQRSQGASSSLGAEFTAGEWLGSRLGGHIAQAESALSKAKGEA